jgi:hypothetical protein
MRHFPLLDWMTQAAATAPITKQKSNGAAGLAQIKKETFRITLIFSFPSETNRQNPI